MSNSLRFLDAYNRTDKALHSRFGFKPSMSFADAVHRAAAINTLVRKFSDELIDFGRLRNAIVHRSYSDMTIAEPHDDVTERFEKIAEILSAPPLASSIAHAPTVVSADTPLKDAIAVMTERGFSNLPTTENGRIVGILSNKSIVKFTARNLGSLDDALNVAVVKDALDGDGTYYSIMRDCSADEILSEFERNRKLNIIILTVNGLPDGKIVGVITIGDMSAVYRALECF